MWRSIKATLKACWLVPGAALWGIGLWLTVQDLRVWGLAPWIWQAVGAGLFLLAVVVLLVRHEIATKDRIEKLERQFRQEPASNSEDEVRVVGVPEPTPVPAAQSTVDIDPRSAMADRLDQVAEDIYGFLDQHSHLENRLYNREIVANFRSEFGATIRGLRKELEDHSGAQLYDVPIDRPEDAVAIRELANILESLARDLRGE